MKSIFYSLILLCICSYSQAQVGVIQYDESINTYYTLFSNTFGNDSYLIDNCGRLINKWSSEKPNGLSAAILPDGRLIRAVKENGSFINQPSTGGGFEIRSWDDQLEWSYKEIGEDYIQHHDFAVLPNGHILFIGWEAILTSDLAAIGMNTENIYSGSVWFEYIKEIKPVGTETEIVWEWHMLDHIIQDFVPGLDNFGVVADHPHKYNLNFSSPLQFSPQDPFHANAIDYNPLRDEIVLNVRSIGELWIIDHSTTTDEAAGETGGNAGKGGDILFRWGNPAAYDRQVQDEDWTLFGAHGVNFVDPGLPDEGKIIIFNNGIARPEGNYSTIEMINPLLGESDNYQFNTDGQFALESHQFIYGENQDLLSEYQSNAHQLPDGDFFINASDLDLMLQVNADKEVVWKYQIPLNNGFPLNQSDNNSYFLSFVSLRYSADYVGFENIDLSPGALIEQNVMTDFCAILPLQETITHTLEFHQTDVDISINVNLNKEDIRLVSLDGQFPLVSSKNNGNHTYIDISRLQSGMYYLQVLDKDQKLHSFPFVSIK